MTSSFKKVRTTTVATTVTAALVLTGAALGTGSAFAAEPTSARTVYGDQIGAETAASYPVNQWFLGYSSNVNRSATVVDDQLVLGANSQILSKYFGDDDLDTLLADGISITAPAGGAHLQIPVTWGTNGFTTLRPEVALEGTSTVAGTDTWISTRSIGGVTTGTFDELVDAIEDIDPDYNVVGFGANSSGGAAIDSFQFDDVAYSFSDELAPAGEATDTARIQLANVGEETPAGYPAEEWFEGDSNYENTGLTVVGSDLVLAPNTQLLKQFTDANRPANLEEFINAGVAYTNGVSEGKVTFQIPLGYGANKFTTLRPAEVPTVGLNTVSYDQLWLHTGTVAGLADDQAYTLAEIVSALDEIGGAQKVFGYGVFAGGPSVVSSIQWDGLATTFADDPALVFDSITIGGTAKVGSTVTADVELNYPGATYSYKWLRDGKKIDGATSSSYTLQANTLGTDVSVVVKATKEDFASVSATSEPITPTAGTIAFDESAEIVGTVQVGKTLTADVDTTVTAALSYRWLRDGSNISKATDAKYKLTAADAGKSISVKVTATRTAFTTKSIVISAEGEVALGSLSIDRPTLSGSAKVGKTLTAKSNGETSGTKLTYRFTVDGETVKSSSSKTLTVKKAWKGSVVRVIVTASKSGYVSEKSALSFGKTVK